MTEDRLLVLADEAYDRVMRPYVFPGARDLVQRAREGGRKIVFISGALDFIVERLADQLGADEVIANRLELKNGVATGKLLKPVVAGPEKARIVRDHARRNGHDLDDCFAFSDSYSDVPMLSVVGHPPP
jgi:HAD superfamily hydrolase (TIGR01490 family)